MKNSKIFALSFLALSVLASACKKDSEQDWNFTTDNSLSEDAYQDVYKSANSVGEGNESDLRASCAQISHSSPLNNGARTYPDTVIVNFGDTTAPCTAQNGVVRSGSLTMIFSGRWRDANTVVRITPNNYRVNANLLGGTKTITRQAANAAGNPVHTVVVQNGSVTNRAGQIRYWACNKTFEWVAGSTTTFANGGAAGVLDDVFHITGTANGTTVAGNTYTVTTNTPLVRRMDCRWITQGVLNIAPASGTGYSLDFGTGACDNQATATFGNNSIGITLN